MPRSRSAAPKNHAVQAERFSRSAGLKADAERQLHSALLVDGAGGLVRVGHAAQVTDRVEVGVVEYVEHLGLAFNQHPLRDPDLLDQVHVEADDLRAGDDQAADTAVAEP